MKLALLKFQIILNLSIPLLLASCSENASFEKLPDYRVHTFYYAWYANPEIDGDYSHWNHNVIPHWADKRWDSAANYPGGDDIGANFYPELGCYSSNDPEVIAKHMKMIRDAGIGVVAISWWGKNSREENSMIDYFNIAHKYDLKIAFHIEPFFKSIEEFRGILEYLNVNYGDHPALYKYKGKPLHYIYDSYKIRPEEWQKVTNPKGELTIRNTDLDAHLIGIFTLKTSGKVIKKAGFDGFYTYYAAERYMYASTPSNWYDINEFALENDLIFIPCVGPGYIDTRIRPWNAGNTKDRKGGEYYEDMFSSAVHINPEIIGITSFNEWHEGTQIEPAIPKSLPGYTYEDYGDGVDPGFYISKTRELIENWQEQREGISISGTKCEYMENPLGIDAQNPRLSWIIESSQRGQKQTAYRVIVASTRENLNKDKGDFWDSGKIQSDQSTQLKYNGRLLNSNDHCFWKVMVWDIDGKPSEWSKAGMWSIGLVDPEDWHAKWIGSPQPTTSVFYRNTFKLEDLPERSEVCISALGYYELFINGKKVGNEVLAPAVSNYSKRTYYRTYDVRRYLTKGKNNIAVRMGTGWYTPGYPGVSHHSPVFRAQLDLLSGKEVYQIVSDTSWECKPGDMKRLGEWAWGKFGGEHLDARTIDENWYDNEKSVKGWSAVEIVQVPDVPCSAQKCNANVTLDKISPIKIEWLDDETVLVDFGTNLTGMIQMVFKNLESGQKVSMYYADLDGRSEEEQWRVRMGRKGFATYNQWDEFISAGAKNEKFENLFNYHAFRYVLIDGLSYLPAAEDLTALPIETRVDEIGSFTCSNDLYNDIHKMVRWTYRCLNLGGQTVDCPHRERLGYGDGQTIMDLGLFNFNTTSLYTKWSQNWWDEQGEDGFVPFTAPCPHTTGGGPAWGAMCIMVPWKTYLFSNDVELLEEGYPYMKKYIEYLNSHCKEGLLQDIFPGEKWPNLGDWVPPRRGMDKQDWVDDNSRRFFNNCYRVHLLQIMQKVAEVIGNENDIRWYAEEADYAGGKIHEAWFNPDDSSYANGEQPYMIFPLLTDITPDNLKKAVFDKYVETLLEEDMGHLNTGMIGTQIMTDYLLEIGRNDLIDTYVNKTTFPGWGYMIEKGATTCWEQWNGYYSQIHSCFPYIGGWFYKGLAGINWDTENPGFKNIILKPGLVESVNFVKSSYKSPYGKILSNWKTEDDSFEWRISVPVNSTASVYIPGIDIRENGKKITDSKYIRLIGTDTGMSVFNLESGTYLFTSKLNITPK